MDRKKVKIKAGSWLARMAAWRLNSDKMAMVIGHTIHLYGSTKSQFLSSPTWVRHELKHVAQFEQLGLIGFLWRYAIESYKNGYWNNALEVEARAAEGDATLQERYTF